MAFLGETVFYYASDYFPKMYEIAVNLIKKVWRMSVNVLRNKYVKIVET